jgi:aerobic-type carbon monoxide dehydrogenase small subunit (CoxS/CutS family)
MGERVNVVVDGRSAEVPADDPLLWVLRDDLGLVGAKYGCGLDQCGACRVLVDGVPVSSCQVPAGDVVGREVATIETLVDTPEGGAVVDALLDRNAGQCGYCLPGVAVTLIGLARRRGVAPMSRDDIARALDAHLCRCGSQPRILRAAMDLFGG